MQSSKERLLSANNRHLDSPLWNTASYNFGTVICGPFYTVCAYFNTVFQVQVGSHGFLFGDKKTMKSVHVYSIHRSYPRYSWKLIPTLFIVALLLSLYSRTKVQGNSRNSYSMGQHKGLLQLCNTPLLLRSSLHIDVNSECPLLSSNYSWPDLYKHCPGSSSGTRPCRNYFTQILT